MNLQKVSESELLEILNIELHRDGDHEGCWFTSVQPLSEIDENGCNWSSANLRCSGVSAATCKLDADQVVQEARAKYRLLDP